MPRYLFLDSYIHRGTIPSVAASDSTSVTINLSDQRGGAGIIRGVRASCDSTNFNISIFSKTGASEDTIFEIYSKDNINLNSNENDLFTMWENADTTPAQQLYLKFTNNSSVESGVINYELLLNLHNISRGI